MRENGGLLLFFDCDTFWAIININVHFLNLTDICCILVAGCANVALQIELVTHCLHYTLRGVGMQMDQGL